MNEATDTEMNAISSAFIITAFLSHLFLLTILYVLAISDAE